MMKLAELLDRDKQWKPPNADEEWGRQSLAYDDQGREKTIEFLQALGVGIKDNEFPIEFNLVRRVVDRLAVVYDKPPTRWVRKPGGGDRYKEASEQHKAMIRALDRSNYDLALHEIDRRRSLHRQVAVRYAASNATKSVVLRYFEPFNVIRAPDPSDPDHIESDLAFGLRMGPRSDPTYEIWERADSGLYTVRRVNKEDAEQASPFEGGKSPYGSTLPVQMIYDQYPAGRAWLPPRSSRTAFIMAFNAIVNDLWSLIVNQAHDETFYRTDNTAGVPDETGHRVRPVLPKDVEVDSVQRTPKIDECREVLTELVKIFVSTEDIPVEEFMRGRQVVTGAALKVQEGPLMARREEQLPLARNDERLGWEKYVAVHNEFAKSWGEKTLPTDLELEVEIADPNLPMDDAELLDSFAKRIALGVASRIDLIQAERGCNRQQAIDRFVRVQDDNEKYRVAGNDDGEKVDEPPPVDGKRPADPEDPNPDPSTSVVQNIRAAQSA
ncbi:MAG: hypothetical protein RMA76_38180 [Deltaproteobacteria bacterium]|jgi:hypothetical protein